jgi:hypothetical protein
MKLEPILDNLISQTKKRIKDFPTVSWPSTDTTGPWSSSEANRGKVYPHPGYVGSVGRINSRLDQFGRRAALWQGIVASEAGH